MPIFLQNQFFNIVNLIVFLPTIDLLRMLSFNIMERTAQISNGPITIERGTKKRSTKAFFTSYIAINIHAHPYIFLQPFRLRKEEVGTHQQHITIDVCWCNADVDDISTTLECYSFYS